MHALIIEQDAWIAMSIEAVLADLGYTSFDYAVCGQDALTLAARRCPDLITSDIRFGGSDGIETVRAICAHRHFIPVVFVTATGWEVRQRSPNAAVVQMPFSPDALKGGVELAMATQSPI